jgi:hypothetical protein
MSIPLLRRLLMKEAVKDTAGSSGIMSINKNIAAKVEQQVQRYVNDAMRQGVDLDTLSPEQLKMIVQMNKPKPPKVFSGQEAVDQLNKLFPKKGEVVDFPQKRSFKQEVDDMIKDGTITKGARGIKKSKKVQDREMFQDANKRLKTEAQLKAEMEASNKKSIASIKNKKMIDDAIDDASPGFADGDTKYDAELVAENLAERMGLVYDDLPTKQRIDLYDQAYTGLSKQRFKGMKKPEPEDMADGGVAGLLGERI